MDIAPETATDEIVLPLSIPAEAVAGNRFLKSRLFRVGASYLVAAVGLAWAFKGTQWKALFGDIAAIRWGWVVPAVLLNILGTMSQGFRWHLLLKPLGGLPTGKTTQALFSGFFINDVLPLRMGELARGYIVSSWMSREFVSIIPSMVLERLFEGIWLAIGIGLTSIIVRLPRTLDRAAGIFGLVVLALAGVVLFITLRKKRAAGKRTSERLAGSRRLGILKSLLQRIEDGFRTIGMTRDFYAAFFVSLLYFGLQMASFWFITKAYGLAFSFWVSSAVFIIVIFGTALPGVPANIGTYQFFCVAALTLFRVGKTEAAGFSLVAFTLLTLPALVIGFFALARTGMTVGSLRETVRRQKI
jgi:glycosyltransferase 2 family protein